MVGRSFIVAGLLLSAQFAIGREPDGGGALPMPTHADTRAFIDQRLRVARANAAKLAEASRSLAEASVLSPPLKWPVREAISVTDPSIQAISNYVDQDPGEGDNAIGDWNCGERTYDGHRGLDVFIAPFSWYKMERDEGIVVAAAAGTIVDKVNNQPERSCAIDNSGGENNLIVIEQSDGSNAVYAHMRTGSVTSRGIGDAVEAGDYLGVIGSAGYSTGPHLHFEVGTWEGNTWVHQDPWQGDCNLLNEQSWWEDQPPYFLPALVSIATHDAAPELPECPETEIPHYQDTFEAGDRIYFATYYRDQLQDQVATMTIRRPDGSVYQSWEHSSEQAHYASSFWYWSIDFPANAMAGEWTFTVEFEGESLSHAFWVDDAPDPAPDMPVSNNARNGLWYDTTLEGEGYNVVTAVPGTVIYFYGSDAQGNRLWLISELITDVLGTGESVTVVMYESTGGTYDSPVPSNRGLSIWGTLEITFTGCSSAVAELRGRDGEKVSQLTKLAGIAGTQCIGGQQADAPYSGLFFDLGLDGEGYNLLVTPFGVVVYYYGFDGNGDRLWLIIGPIEETMEPGVTMSGTAYRADQGTFAQPVPSAQALVDWGTLEIEVDGCNSITFTLETNEGDKISHTIRLAGVVGLQCG